MVGRGEGHGIVAVPTRPQQGRDQAAGDELRPLVGGEPSHVVADKRFEPDVVRVGVGVEDEQAALVGEGHQGAPEDAPFLVPREERLLVDVGRVHVCQAIDKR